MMGQQRTHVADLNQLVKLGLILKISRPIHSTPVTAVQPGSTE